MKNLANNLVIHFICMLILIILLISAFEVVIFNKNYYDWHYNKYNIMEHTMMSIEDLHETMDETLQYFLGNREDLEMRAVVDGQERQVYNEKEILHLIDVQVLFLGAIYIRNIGFGIILIAIIYLLFRNQRLFKHLLRTLERFLWIALGGFGLLIVVISSNFAFFFELFHLISFSNDLWLLDPATDILINIVPLEFFINICILIGSAFVFLALITIFITHVYQKIINLGKV